MGLQLVYSEQCTMLIVIGKDGASANIAAAGLKGLMRMRFLGVGDYSTSARTTVAVKDALKGKTFDGEIWCTAVTEKTSMFQVLILVRFTLYNNILETQ